jgi:hypothetical protein
MLSLYPRLCGGLFLHRIVANESYSRILSSHFVSSRVGAVRGALPAKYLVDTRGRIVCRQSGEGGRTREAAIRPVLAAACGAAAMWPDANAGGRNELENRFWQSVLQPLRPDFLQDGGGNLFDGLGGGGQPAYAFAPHHGFGFVDFLAAVLKAGVLGVGPAFVADLG